MNHRQWKKEFKKQHNRNPEWFEDRKRLTKVKKKLINNMNRFVKSGDSNRCFSKLNYTSERAGNAIKKALKKLSE